MARYRSDIPYGYDDLSQVGFWTPETPEFLEKRDARRAAQRSSANTYTQARDNIHRISVEGRAVGAANRADGESASIIDFESARHGYGRPSNAPATRRRASSDARGAGHTGGTPGGAARAGRGRRGSSAGSAYAEAGLSRRESPGSRTRGAARRDLAGGAYSSAYAYDDAYADDAYASAPYGEGAHEPGEGRGLRGRLRKAQHDRRSRKADRDFAQRYADDPVPEAAGPRAAVYKGKMGRQHHRAARMQDSRRMGGGFQIPAFLSAFAGMLRLDRLLAHRVLTATLVTVACMAFITAGAFPAMRGYYVQVRENDQLAAEYQAVLERNKELEQHVAALQTDEGMEQLAHESLGWVREGDHSVSVLADGSADPASGYGDVDSVASGSVPAPETWYSPVLDVVFGYDGTTG